MSFVLNDLTWIPSIISWSPSAGNKVIKWSHVWRVWRFRKSRKDRQNNGQKKKDKSTNNDLQNIHIKLKIELREPH